VRVSASSSGRIHGLAILGRHPPVHPHTWAAIERDDRATQPQTPSRWIPPKQKENLFFRCPCHLSVPYRRRVAPPSITIDVSEFALEADNLSALEVDDLSASTLTRSPSS